MYRLQDKHIELMNSVRTFTFIFLLGLSIGVYVTVDYTNHNIENRMYEIAHNEIGNYPHIVSAGEKYYQIIEVNFTQNGVILHFE